MWVGSCVENVTAATNETNNPGLPCSDSVDLPGEKKEKSMLSHVIKGEKTIT